MDALTFDPKSAALVLIDLQKGIVARQTAPYASADVVTRARRLADGFRAAGATVVLVHVGFSADGRDRLKPRADQPMPGGPVAPDFAEFVPELTPQTGDVVITKRNWGAFYGTDLELQLRRRGVRTIVLGGISTNYGVESTARDAFERAYALVLVEDAMAGMSAEAHTFAVTNIFPRFGQVRSTEQVLAALAAGR